MDYPTSMDDIADALFDAGYIEGDVFQNILFVYKDGGGDITDRDLDIVFDIATMYDNVDVWSDTHGTISIAVGV
ncbi:hypothetical protein OAG62_01565 [bacterium]|nr:hypothetical protein [bacterium]